MVTITQLFVTSQFELFETQWSIPVNLDVLILRPQQISKSKAEGLGSYLSERHILEYQ